MILGKTGTAKTTTWKGLQGAMGRLKKKKVPGFEQVSVYPINPKALNLGELYGEYNLSTNEWLDGVISATMRITCVGKIKNLKPSLIDLLIITYFLWFKSTVLYAVPNLRETSWGRLKNVINFKRVTVTVVFRVYIKK